MSIKNNKNAIELLSLILSLMDDDDRAELRAAMDEGEEPKDEPTLCDECSDRDTCPDSPLRLNDDNEWEWEFRLDDDNEWDDKDEDDEDEPDDDNDASTIEITIPDGMPCIVIGGTGDELPLAIELIKEMGLVSPVPAPALNKSRVRGEMVNRNQNVPEGSLSGKTLREMIDRIVEAAKEPAEGSAAWLDKYHY